MRERPFTNEVIALARDHNWDVFHIHDQDSYENYRKIATGAGYPDLIMYRTDQRGETSMIVAELKTDADNSAVRPNQEEWLRAYEQFVPTFVWRPSDWPEIQQVLRDGPSPSRVGRATGQVDSARGKERILLSNLKVIVDNLRSDIREQEFSTGHRAQLRRLNPEVLGPAAFWRLFTRRNLSKIGGPDSQKKWAAVIQGIALMTGHDRGSPTPLGRALFSGGDQERTKALYSEHRLNQLLAARGQLLRTLLRRAFRILVGTEQAIYWPQVAELILYDGNNEDEAEKVRHQIASDYYRAEAIALRRVNRRDNQEDLQ